MTNVIKTFEELSTATAADRAACFNPKALANAASGSAATANVFFTNAVRAWMVDSAAHSADLGKMLGTVDHTLKNMKGATKNVYKALTSDFTKVMKSGLGAEYTGSGREKTLQLAEGGLTHIRFANIENHERLETNEDVTALLKIGVKCPVVSNSAARMTLDALKTMTIAGVADSLKPVKYGKVEKLAQAIAKNTNEPAKYTVAIAKFNAGIDASGAQEVRVGKSVNDLFNPPAEKPISDDATVIPAPVTGTDS